MKTLALTGHRDLPDTFDDGALKRALSALVFEGYRNILCGMARGFDLRALEILLSSGERPSLTFEACVPYAGQERGFSESEKERYKTLLSRCEKKTVLFDRYQSGCFLARDRYMVDRADALFAYCERDRGGTAYTVRYAQKKGIPVIFL